LSEPLLRALGLTKRFGALTALAGVDLEVDAGEVHAILGENGAGKTTLVNLLFGMLRPDAGRLVWRGADVTFRSPHDACSSVR
jgi:simple sugar transport system ATP-binding protein